jgi:hypothetical protein
MRSGTRRFALIALVVLAAAWAPSGLQAQATGGLDLSDLELPDGLLELSDVVAYGGSGGGVTALATTSFLGAPAEVLFSATPAVSGRREWLLAVQPDEWSFAAALPGLDNPVLDGLVISGVVLVATNREVTLESATLPDDEYWYYREAFPRDEFTLTLGPGVNLFGTIPADALPADHPLRAVMDALGIESGGLFLQGTLGQSLSLLGGGAPGGAVRDLYLRAELPALRPPGSPAWFRSGQLALELTGDPSVRLVGEVTVNIDETDLLFFLAASLARTGVSLAGGLQAEDGWQQPFGIPWLVMNGVVAKIGITPTGSIQLGFGGDMVIGEKDIAVAVAVALNAATGVPTNFIFEGESEAGFGLSDLVMLQGRMAAARRAAASAAGAESAGAGPPAIPLDALPPVDFRDVGLTFAPRPEPDLGVERGMAIRGRLWLPVSADGEPTDFAGVDVSVSEDGLWARGDLGAFELGPLTWNDAELDLTATRDDQHLLVTGEVELLGSRQLVDVQFARRTFSFRTETRIHDMFTADISAVSEFRLRDPAFQVDAVAHADFGDLVGPLVQQGAGMFAGTGEEALGAARDASAAAGRALADSEATLAELVRVLEAQRRAAGERRESARGNMERALSSMRSALALRNRALRSYSATPRRQLSLRASRLAAYRTYHGRYLVRAAAYGAARARFATADRVYRAVPPPDERLAVIAASEAVAEVRARLETMQANLAALEDQYRRVSDALQRGEQLLLIERAEFHAGLEAAQRGEAVQWSIQGAFAGSPFEIEETLDFTDAGAGAAGLLEALLFR